VDRIRLEIIIQERRKIEKFELDPNMSVRETVAFVERSKYQGANWDPQNPLPHEYTINNELFFITNANANDSGNQQPVKMEFDRTIASYRLKASVCLISDPRSPNVFAIKTNLILGSINLTTSTFGDYHLEKSSHSIKCSDYHSI
jgi:hypothetical protein